jgi:glycosyltransferase involved in cell wall biosynthesis
VPPFLSIIIPAHNEERRLPGSLDQILAFLRYQRYAAEVLVVENGSADRTAEVARSFADRHSNVRLLLEASRGKGLAVRRGMLEAQGNYRFICDADLSMPIEQVNRFVPPELEVVEVAIASREALGAARYGEPAYRHTIGRAFNLLVRLLALPGLQDTQCGFKCFSARTARDLFAVQRLDGLGFDVEVLYIAQLRGYRVAEIPIPWYFNPDSRVRLFRDSWAMLTDLIRIRRNAARGLYAPRF